MFYVTNLFSVNSYSTSGFVNTDVSSIFKRRWNKQIKKPWPFVGIFPCISRACSMTQVQIFCIYGAKVYYHCTYSGVMLRTGTGVTAKINMITFHIKVFESFFNQMAWCRGDPCNMAKFRAIFLCLITKMELRFADEKIKYCNIYLFTIELSPTCVLMCIVTYCELKT